MIQPSQGVDPHEVTDAVNGSEQPKWGEKRTANVRSSHSGAGCNRNDSGFLYVFLSERRDNGTEQ